MSLGRSFVLTLFTNNPDLARLADTAGINRIGLDLEKFGKHRRQAHLHAWISDHTLEQIHPLRRVIRRGQLFARVNPIHVDSRSEIEYLIQSGVHGLMLPMFQTHDEVLEFIQIVHGRAQVSLLLETAAAARQIGGLVRVRGIDEIHVGLNDLHLDLKLKNHFELLTSPLMEHLSRTIRAAGIAFGFGGIARTLDTTLPISPDLVYAQYPRLGGDRALVARAFMAPDYKKLDLVREVELTRARLDWWQQRTHQELEQARLDLTTQAGAHSV
jgi:hypothetical protein